MDTLIISEKSLKICLPTIYIFESHLNIIQILFEYSVEGHY